jgi:hypothetical protein
VGMQSKLYLAYLVAIACAMQSRTYNSTTVPCLMQVWCARLQSDVVSVTIDGVMGWI